MAYLKPPWFTVKVFNKIAMATGVSGSETLTVTARTSGQEQNIPVITVEVDGARYLVSTRGESQWVKNVRANPVVTLDTKVWAARFTAAEVPVADRPPVLAAYRVKAGKTVDGYFAKLPDPADHPVFRLEPV
ncbi:nitroreductase/quinone reductase family protein [Mycolicibacterium sphagni]|uniref:Nitroreductase family deazaflavin-dependent oxidoreductase n=1 Tax=Mycolicibacterium sphagni TaxID=1786 RepID=A0A255DEB8_9MYCO|nr:nitroreductase/quinone reductase family protein [Mycolicibacterium sphagni]MCV7177295.1 nitroreductase family deazaflavin-dependent oxidoreductase [Mycolicibacterium sphagni]OYN77736.1 nitroreductase family deazaflavin-dependent oxidoreductase [Mycolicibacterium sphagni]